MIVVYAFLLLWLLGFSIGILYFIALGVARFARWLWELPYLPHAFAVAFCVAAAMLISLLFN